MRQIVQRVVILGILAFTLLVGFPVMVQAEFGLVRMGVDGMT